jgi:hypothetical protein
MLDIHSYGVLLSYMWYTKQLLFCHYLFSSLAGMLNYLDPPLAPLWFHLSSDIGSFPVVGIHVEPLHVFENSVVTMDILGVVAMN